MSTEIYYFSGTGNSLYVAKELRNRLADTPLIPMASLLHQDVVATGAETVGLVFPVHAMMLPLAVRRFLEKLDVSSARYVFAVTTHGGTLALVDVALKRILNDKGSGLDAYFIQKMPWNSPIGLMPVYIPGMIHYPPDPERIEALTAATTDRLDAIAAIVASREPNPADDSPRRLRLSLKRTGYSLMESADPSKGRSQIPFYAADGCTQCGTCASVCLSGRIATSEARPVWREDVECYHCYACFAHCPTQSVLLKGRYDKRNGRYSHPEISAREIAAQLGGDVRRASADDGSAAGESA